MFRAVIFSTTRFVKPSGLSLLKERKILYSNHAFARTFHTTHQRCIHPLLALILRPLAKTASIFTGKVFRNWWKQLSPGKKDFYKKKYLLNPRFWAIPIGATTIGGGIFYFTHLETTPITNRTRFLLFKRHQLDQLSEMQMEQQLEECKDSVLDPKHALHAKVWKVVENLVKSNADIEEVKSQKWVLHVVDNKIENAFVLPNGHIFVYTGLLQITKNDDQLAFILGHEMAHAVLGHGAEKLSISGIINVFTAFGLLLIWAVLPDAMAAVFQGVQNKISDVLLELPYSRKLELEADEVGLQFVSKACFDVRESSIFWRNWAAIAAVQGSEEAPEFLSTHPTNETRAVVLDRLIPEAITRRKDCKCPDLAGNPTPIDIETLKKMVEKNKVAKTAAAAALAK